MGKTVVVPMFLKHEYNAILSLGDLELPATYDGWLEHRAKEKTKHAARGDIEKEAVVHPQKFSAYCQDCGQDASFTMLNAFVVTEGHKQK